MVKVSLYFSTNSLCSSSRLLLNSHLPLGPVFGRKLLMEERLTSIFITVSNSVYLFFPIPRNGSFCFLLLGFVSKSFALIIFQFSSALLHKSI